MATTFCPHPLPLSKVRDWYSQDASPAETRPVHGYEIKKVERYQRVKRSYSDCSIATRRLKLYREALALLKEEKGQCGSQSYVQVRGYTVDLERRLRQQSDKWEKETAHLSSPLQRMMHPSYQAILAMSSESVESKRETIRFLLKDLKLHQRDWFLALSYLTQQDPIDPSDYGKTGKMVTSWLEWGAEQGLLDR